MKKCFKFLMICGLVLALTPHGKAADGTSNAAKQEVKKNPSPEVISKADASMIPTARFSTTPKGWFDDVNAAREAAKKSQRPMLMLFTGSDWCHWCVRLREEVLQTPEFEKFAQKNLILVFIDIPRSGLPKDALRANQQLMRLYGVRGVPNAVIMNCDAKEIGRVGYRKDFIQEVTNLLKKAGCSL